MICSQWVISGSASHEKYTNASRKQVNQNQESSSHAGAPRFGSFQRMHTCILSHTKSNGACCSKRVTRGSNQIEDRAVMDAHHALRMSNANGTHHAPSE